MPRRGRRIYIYIYIYTHIIMFIYFILTCPGGSRASVGATDSDDLSARVGRRWESELCTFYVSERPSEAGGAKG